MIFGFPLLSVAIWLPIIFGVLVLATGHDRNAPLARMIALLFLFLIPPPALAHTTYIEPLPPPHSHPILIAEPINIYCENAGSPPYACSATPSGLARYIESKSSLSITCDFTGIPLGSFSHQWNACHNISNTVGVHGYWYKSCPKHVSGNWYKLNFSTLMCEFTIYDHSEDLTITLSGDSNTTEPWHKKHDKEHLKANLPYKAIVKDQNGQPKVGINVTITTDVTLNSGGHIHTNGRPKGKLVAGTGASTKAGKETITGTTNGSGVFEFTFGAEESSGTHTLTAKCDSGCQAPATATVDVSIKDLMLLDADPLGYTLVGSTGTHPDNHYFSPAAAVKIINLAHRYKKEFNKQKYKNPPYIGIFKTPLVINDSSLKKGGTFDILNDWTSVMNMHGGHRQGVVVDINGIKEESLDFEELAEECCKIIADWHPGGTGPHYHLKLLGRDQ